ncbi:MAG: PmoA family protein [Planctomycetes bacterium]|nr:PmoA family protein [Planctomycetota bacterium]
MKRTAVVLVVFVLCAAALGNARVPKVEFIKGKNKIDVMIGGKHFTSYVYGNELTKPMMVPLRSPSGVVVTRRNPLVKMKGGSDDHQHHVGIFFAVDKVNGTNFWNNAAPPPQIKHIKTTEVTGNTGKGKLATVMHWIDRNGNVLLEENRSMVFLAGENEDEYAIDFSIDLTARQTEVVFEDIEEGVFAIRVADCLREGDSKVILKPGQPLPKESVSGTGRYFSSNGDETAKNVWGKRARWVALQGIRKGKVVGVAILNHPESINYPTYWHVRSYGLFSANPLGQGDFQRQSKYKKNPVQPLRLTLKQGQRVHFRFLVVVYEGMRTKEQMEERFREFVK